MKCVAFKYLSWVKKCLESRGNKEDGTKSCWWAHFSVLFFGLSLREAWNEKWNRQHYDYFSQHHIYSYIPSLHASAYVIVTAEKNEHAWLSNKLRPLNDRAVFLTSHDTRSSWNSFVNWQNYLQVSSKGKSKSSKSIIESLEKTLKHPSEVHCFKNTNLILTK